MALDTRDKRASAVSIRKPWGVLLPLPDSSITQPDRQQLLGAYAGINAAAGLSTASKRASAISAMRVGMRAVPIPDGTVGGVDRAHLGRAYSGSTFGAPENTGQVLVTALASGVGTINASGTCAVVITAAGNLATPPAVQEANVSITATASGDVIETIDPVNVVVTAAAGAVVLASATCSVGVNAAAFGKHVVSGECSVFITSSAREASTSGPTAGVAGVNVQVLADASGQFASSGTAGAVVSASAVGALNAFANSQIVVTANANGDDGVPDPVSGFVAVVVSCTAVGSIIAPNLPTARGPTSKTIDFKSLTDYYGRRTGRVPVYRFSGGRNFYEGGQ